MLPILVTTLYNIQFSLWMMAQGMLGIFVFMSLFYLLIWGLEKVFKAEE